MNGYPCNTCDREWSTAKLAMNCTHRPDQTIPTQGFPPIVQEAPLKAANGLKPEERLKK